MERGKRTSWSRWHVARTHAHYTSKVLDKETGEQDDELVVEEEGGGRRRRIWRWAAVRDLEDNAAICATTPPMRTVKAWRPI